MTRIEKLRSGGMGQVRMTRGSIFGRAGGGHMDRARTERTEAIVSHCERCWAASRPWGWMLSWMQVSRTHDLQRNLRSSINSPVALSLPKPDYKISPMRGWKDGDGIQANFVYFFETTRSILRMNQFRTKYMLRAIEFQSVARQITPLPNEDVGQGSVEARAPKLGLEALGQRSFHHMTERLYNDYRDPEQGLSSVTRHRTSELNRFGRLSHVTRHRENVFMGAKIPYIANVHLAPASHEAPSCSLRGSVVEGLAWPESPGFGLALAGFVKPQARPDRRAWAWLGLGSGLFNLR
ncbi:hypothetical protein BKA93DRAFT_878271 [Sparassis latifolia]